MINATPWTSRNRILAGLTEARLALLAPHLAPVELELRMVLEVPGEPIAHVYFPASGVISVVAVGTDKRRIEVGLFGRDGMSGLAVVLGDDRSPHETLVQVPGFGHRLAADALREAMADAPLRDHLLHFAQAFSVQTAYTALANGRHNIEERLARWLLMCHDRGEGDALALTHDFLATMLGVRRAGVTVALHMLEGRGLIKATRGRIQVLDRGDLERAATGLYGPPEAEYARLMAKEVARA
jgi:CRP-like cAMP-binding protein